MSALLERAAGGAHGRRPTRRRSRALPCALALALTVALLGACGSSDGGDDDGDDAASATTVDPNLPKGTVPFIVCKTPVADAVAKTAVLTGMIVLIHVVWALAGSALAGLLRDPRASRIVNVALAGLLVLTSALALWPGASP